MTQLIGKGVANQLAGYVDRRISRILSMPAPGPQKALLANLRRGAGKAPASCLRCGACCWRISRKSG